MAASESFGPSTTNTSLWASTSTGSAGIGGTTCWSIGVAQLKNKVERRSTKEIVRTRLIRFISDSFATGKPSCFLSTNQNPKTVYR